MSTDYLLKDECETPQPIEGVEPSDKDFPLKKVSVEDANDFMEVRKKNAPKIAAAVAACIVSPSVLIFLAGFIYSVGSCSPDYIPEETLHRLPDAYCLLLRYLQTCLPFLREKAD